MNLIHILNEFLVMMQSRASRMGIDLTDIDFDIWFEWENPSGWRITSLKTNRLYRIEGW